MGPQRRQAVQDNPPRGLRPTFLACCREASTASRPARFLSAAAVSAAAAARCASLLSLATSLFTVMVCPAKRRVSATVTVPAACAPATEAAALAAISAAAAADFLCSAPACPAGLGLEPMPSCRIQACLWGG
jgi:hypothetical protein